MSPVDGLLVLASLVFWGMMLGFNLLAWYLSARRFKSGKELDRLGRVEVEGNPGVTILRPINGKDFQLESNLESSFLQDYPNFEILFCVASASDGGVDVVRRLIAKYPHVKARLVIDDTQYGVNPKVNNLVKACSEAQNDVLWVCDSNVYVNRGCLGRALNHLLTPGVGLVHHVPVGVQAANFGACLEATFLNTNHVKMYGAVNVLHLDSCIVGKSCLYRRSTLDRFGGMRAARHFLSEDNWIGKQMLALGLRHEMGLDLVYQPLGRMDLHDFFMRRARWTRLRKYITIPGTLLEPLTECFLNGLVASFGFNALVGVHPLNFFAFHIVLWFVVDMMIFQSLTHHPIDFRRFLVTWAFREISVLPLFIYGVMGTSLVWRGKCFTISDETRAIPSIKPAFSVLRYPLVSRISAASLTAIHLLADILHMSQRNGRDEDGAPIKDDKVTLPFLEEEKGQL
ncbi:Ceramide glucosyltransferase [Massospora cicadina]|nr:Ceramide glucosyltransferase [Massospora cicadina]